MSGRGGLPGAKQAQTEAEHTALLQRQGGLATTVRVLRFTVSGSLNSRSRFCPVGNYASLPSRSDVLQPQYSLGRSCATSGMADHVLCGLHVAPALAADLWGPGRQGCSP